MIIKFITGNKYKFEEISTLLAPIKVKQVDIDLRELQALNIHKIIIHKLQEALKYETGEIIVEDSSFYLECLNGLPGPHIKWFLEALGIEGLVNLVEKLGNPKAEAITIIGYAKNSKDIHFFEGSITGKVVKPKGRSQFGWESIFLPDGFNQTFGEMSQEEKHVISMRGIAARKLKEYLVKKQI